MKRSSSNPVVQPRTFFCKAFQEFTAFCAVSVAKEKWVFPEAFPAHVTVQLSTINMSKAEVKCYYEKDSGTAQYIVSCPKTKKAAIIDSVLDYDSAAGSTSTLSADKLVEYVTEQKLTVDWILETHAHADHLTAAPYLKKKLGGKAKICIGALIPKVQATFDKIYAAQWKTDGSQFDKLFQADEKFKIGDLEVTAMHAPGHTPDHLAYHIPGDAIFTGDSMFMPDSGTARCDFPNGSAEELWNTTQKILALPPTTRVFVGHDYGKGGARDPAWETTVAEEKKGNIHVKDGSTKKEFVEFRATRDGTLGHPRLIIPAIQVNLMAGKFPKPDASGQIFLKSPVNLMFQIIVYENTEHVLSNDVMASQKLFECTEAGLPYTVEAAVEFACLFCATQDLITIDRGERDQSFESPEKSIRGE
eukprot:g2231.t1